MPAHGSCAPRAITSPNKTTCFLAHVSIGIYRRGRHRTRTLNVLVFNLVHGQLLPLCRHPRAPLTKALKRRKNMLPVEAPPHNCVAQFLGRLHMWRGLHDARIEERREARMQLPIFLHRPVLTMTRHRVKECCLTSATDGTLTGSAIRRTHGVVLSCHTTSRTQPTGKWQPSA